MSQTRYKCAQLEICFTISRILDIIWVLRWLWNVRLCWKSMNPPSRQPDPVCIKWISSNDCPAICVALRTAMRKEMQTIEITLSLLWKIAREQKRKRKEDQRVTPGKVNHTTCRLLGGQSRNTQVTERKYFSLTRRAGWAQRQRHEYSGEVLRSQQWIRRGRKVEVSSADYKKYITKNYDLRLTVFVSLVERKIVGICIKNYSRSSGSKFFCITF